MAEQKINRFVALGVFFAVLVVYLKTLSVTVVFWDVGEFCAAAWLMQVPHPPGSPLFLILARVVAMIPFYADIAARMHAISSFAGAFASMFLYLIAVKLITRFRGVPANLGDRLIVYGSSVIGALAIAFSTTFWDNSIEAEVYGLSMLFVSMIVWLALRWWERSDEPHNERYLLLICYLVGLSIGVHLLSLLILFTVMMIVYFRKYEYTRKNLIRFTAISVPIFFIIYPGIVQYMPSMLDGDFAGIKSELWPFMPLIITAVVGYFAYKSIKTKQKWVNIAAFGFLLIVLGYTTYIEVLIRANVHTPMNENNPNNLARLVSYLGREQYGNTPLLKAESWDNDVQGYVVKLFPRRYSQEAMHEPTRVNYTSDMDFFWRYQIQHMFLRYFMWNFVGAEGDWQDAGVGWKETYGIPFFVGLLGMFYHLRRDWRNFLPIFAMFIVMGLVFSVYANNQDPQPRERDYFYVGMFYAFSIWIAIGVVGIADMIKERLKNPAQFQLASSAVLLLAFVTVPVSLLRMNYHEHDRSKNYVAWDYSYNLLQSCDPDAILFTNGDNDTFPLWYLQDVEGVRRDVRIANLSLINTNWYIAQLKNEKPFGTPQVPISFTNEQIDRLQPQEWKERTIDIAVPDEAIKQFGVTDSTILKNKKISYKMSGVQISSELRILRVQDIMVRDIINTNNWKRPINFAVTCSPDSKIGLDHYLWMQGMVWRLKPVFDPNPEGGLDAPLMESQVLTENVEPVKTPHPGFRYRNLNNKDVYYDENISRMVMNYRASFLRLAENAALTQNDRPKASKILDQMERIIPMDVIPNQDWRYTYRMMSVSHDVGDEKHAQTYSNILEAKCRELMVVPGTDKRELSMLYQVLLEIYESRKDYTNAIDILGRLQGLYPEDPSIKSRIDMDQKMLSAGASKDTAKK